MKLARRWSAAIVSSPRWLPLLFVAPGFAKALPSAPTEHAEPRITSMASAWFKSRSGPLRVGKSKLGLPAGFPPGAGGV